MKIARDTNIQEESEERHFERPTGYKKTATILISAIMEFDIGC